MCARHLVFKEPPRLGEPDQNIELAWYVSSNFERPAVAATSGVLGGYDRRDQAPGNALPDYGEPEYYDRTAA